MLNELHIKNIVLIDDLKLEFSKGLTGFTGETGAGKSILLDSLGLALGARADASLIRKGTNTASVTAIFSVSPTHPAQRLIEEQELETQDDIIIRRTLSADGKSKCFINDQPVGVNILRQIGDALADIHGQFETYGLLNPASHRGFLDDFAGLRDDLIIMQRDYAAMVKARQDWDEAINRAQKAKDDEEFLMHAVEHLSELNPKAGEETELTSIKQALSQREFIVTALNDIDSIITNDKGAEAALIKIARHLQKLLDKQNLTGGDEAMDHIDHALTNLQEVARFIDNARNQFEHSEHNLESIDDRLYALRAAARKYQCAVETLEEKYDEFKAMLASLKIADDEIKKCEAAFITAERIAFKTARHISLKRIEAAHALDDLVAQELPPLKLAKAKFKTAINEKPLSALGIDDVSFTVATNSDSDFGALNKVASGGEMARFMLAIKVVLASKVTEAQTFVFDEIDTGIGGSTAAAVGARLCRMAEHHQVLVVTHSPQVASTAAHHFTVKKEAMKTDVIHLSPPARIEEIARMLSGSVITDEARAAARILLAPDKKSAA